LNRRKNYFCQLLYEHGIDGVRQAEIYTAEPLGPQPETAIDKLKTYKSPGTDQILAELNQAGDEVLRFKIHKVIWNMGQLAQQ
jgi:hypothetical protein